MILLKSLAWSFLFLWNSLANATIYLVAADPASRSVGIAVISSGPVMTYNPHPATGVKGVGFTGWSGSAANVDPSMDKKVYEMMRQGVPAEQIASFVNQQIDGRYSRYIFVSTQGSMGFVFPSSGCAQPECGGLFGSDHQFFILGGGLEHDVVPKSVQSYEIIRKNPALPFECKLLSGVQAIINAGGEKEEFREAGISVDRPDQPQQKWFKSIRAPEFQIVATLQSELAKSGIQCPAIFQRPDLIRKSGRSRVSRDLP